MRVDPSGNIPVPQTPAKAAPREAGKAAESAGSSSTPDLEAFAPTGELAKLLEAVKQTPEVRTDVIESVAARLAAGEFNTPEAAGDAARALLNPDGNATG
jgi:hypothetical protein